MPSTSRVPKASASPSGPVDALARRDDLAPVVELPLDLAVDVEALGHVAQPVADRPDLVDRHRGVAADVFAARRLQPGPRALQPVGLVGLEAVGGLEGLVEPLLVVGDEPVGLLVGDHALVDQLAGVERAGRRQRPDPLVHQRLGEGRLVALVVAVAAVAEHVDDDVAVELVAVLGGDARDVDDRLGVVAVDVEDRRLDDLGHFRAIGARAAVHRVGGEADLVVDDEMDRAAGAVAPELRQVEGLGDQPLSGEGGVAVQQQAHHLDARLFVGPALGALGLLGADLAAAPPG